MWRGFVSEYWGISLKQAEDLERALKVFPNAIKHTLQEHGGKEIDSMDVWLYIKRKAIKRYENNYDLPEVIKKALEGCTLISQDGDIHLVNRDANIHRNIYESFLGYLKGYEDFESKFKDAVNNQGRTLKVLVKELELKTEKVKERVEDGHMSLQTASYLKTKINEALDILKEATE